MMKCSTCGREGMRIEEVRAGKCDVNTQECRIEEKVEVEVKPKVELPKPTTLKS